MANSIAKDLSERSASHFSQSYLEQRKFTALPELFLSELNDVIVPSSGESQKLDSRLRHHKNVLLVSRRCASLGDDLRHDHQVPRFITWRIVPKLLPERLRKNLNNPAKVAQGDPPWFTYYPHGQLEALSESRVQGCGHAATTRRIGAVLEFGGRRSDFNGALARKVEACSRPTKKGWTQHALPPRRRNPILASAFPEFHEMTWGVDGKRTAGDLES